MDEDNLIEVVTAKFLFIWNHYAGSTADGKPTRPLVLTGFHLGSELHHLIKDFDQVVKTIPFAACVDIEDMIMFAFTPTYKPVHTSCMKLSMETVGLSLRESSTMEEVAAGRLRISAGADKAP